MFMSKKLSLDYAAVHHSILRLLVALSRDNLTKSYMPSRSVLDTVGLPRAADDGQASLVRQFLKDEEDQDWRFETAEDSEDEDDDSFVDCERVRDDDLQARNKVSERVELHRPTENTSANLRLNYRSLWEGSGNVLYGGFPFNVKGIQL